MVSATQGYACLFAHILIGRDGRPPSSSPSIKPIDKHPCAKLFQTIWHKFSREISIYFEPQTALPPFSLHLQERLRAVSQSFPTPLKLHPLWSSLHDQQSPHATPPSPGSVMAMAGVAKTVPTSKVAQRVPLANPMNWRTERIERLFAKGFRLRNLEDRSGFVTDTPAIKGRRLYPRPSPQMLGWLARRYDKLQLGLRPPLPEAHNGASGEVP